MTQGIGSMFGTVALLSVCLGLVTVRFQKHGGIWFWRLGPVGGSFYISRKQEG